MWSPAITVAPPATLAVTRAQVKEFLRLDAGDTAFDNEVDAWIAGVIGEAEAITGTRLITQTVRLRADSFADLLALPIGPVQEIALVGYLDPGADAQIVPAERYELIGAGLATAIRPVPGAIWPPARPITGAIAVTAVVGYGDGQDAIPPDIRIALLRAIRGYFDDKPIDLAPLLGNHRIWL